MNTTILSNETLRDATYLPENRTEPTIHETAAIRSSQITGNVIISENVHIVNAAIRADEGTPFFIGKGSNVQDFCVLHGYVVRDKDTEIHSNLIFVEDTYYSIYIGERVTIAHGALIHGPAFIGDNSFIGFKSTIDAAVIGNNVEIGAHSYIKRVSIPDNVAICPNAVITKEEDIEKYIIDTTGINNTIVNVNLEMAEAYKLKYRKSYKV
jgi:carbonic anhydrase/acetyltransferase-like protein (isoleucine patch superfamily)